MINWGYLGRLMWFQKIACQTRSNHNKGELGCVPEPLLKHHQKGSKVSLKIWYVTCIFIKDDQQESWWSSMASNMDMAHDNMDMAHGDRVWHQTWTWTWLYGKQGYLNNKYKTNSCISSRGIKSQLDIKQTILKRISWMSGPTLKP